jgi:uncharacterized membrane protein YgaE (UPF0421/DUF939 family)
MKTPQLASLKKSLVHPARTTIAALLALLAARLVGLPEFYWAPISALIVMQSNLGASLASSLQLLAGTALGAFTGGLLAAHFGPSVIGFGLVVFGIGLLSAAVRLEPSANRFAVITLAIVLFHCPVRGSRRQRMGQGASPVRRVFDGYYRGTARKRAVA